MRRRPNTCGAISPRSASGFAASFSGEERRPFAPVCPHSAQRGRSLRQIGSNSHCLRTRRRVTGGRGLDRCPSSAAVRRRRALSGAGRQPRWFRTSSPRHCWWRWKRPSRSRPLQPGERRNAHRDSAIQDRSAPFRRAETCARNRARPFSPRSIAPLSSGPRWPVVGLTSGRRRTPKPLSTGRGGCLPRSRSSWCTGLDRAAQAVPRYRGARGARV